MRQNFSLSFRLESGVFVLFSFFFFLRERYASALSLSLIFSFDGSVEHFVWNVSFKFTFYHNLSRVYPILFHVPLYIPPLTLFSTPRFNLYTIQLCSIPFPVLQSILHFILGSLLRISDFILHLILYSILNPISAFYTFYFTLNFCSTFRIPRRALHITFHIAINYAPTNVSLLSNQRA